MKDNSFVVMRKFTQASLAICLCSALACLASDEKRETVFVNDIQQTLKLGHIVWLETGGKSF